MPFTKVYLLFTIHAMVLVTSVYNVGGFLTTHSVRTHHVFFCVENACVHQQRPVHAVPRVAQLSPASVRVCVADLSPTNSRATCNKLMHIIIRFKCLFLTF